MERSYYRFLKVELATQPCEVCGSEVRWLTPNQTVAITGLSLREIFRSIEADSMHFYELASGLLLVCPNSLPGVSTRRID